MVALTKGVTGIAASCLPSSPTNTFLLELLLPPLWTHQAELRRHTGFILKLSLYLSYPLSFVTLM